MAKLLTVLILIWCITIQLQVLRLDDSARDFAKAHNKHNQVLKKIVRVFQ